MQFSRTTSSTCRLKGSGRLPCEHSREPVLKREFDTADFPLRNASSACALLMFPWLRSPNRRRQEAHLAHRNPAAEHPLDGLREPVQLLKRRVDVRGDTDPLKLRMLNCGHNDAVLLEQIACE